MDEQTKNSLLFISTIPVGHVLWAVGFSPWNLVWLGGIQLFLVFKMMKPGWERERNNSNT